MMLLIPHQNDTNDEAPRNKHVDTPRNDVDTVSGPLSVCDDNPPATSTLPSLVPPLSLGQLKEVVPLPSPFMHY